MSELISNEILDISGVVGHILFYNENNHYIVFRLDTEDDDIICVGYSSNIMVGNSYNVKGSYVDNPKYGIQFKFNLISETIPKSLDGLEKYLSSGVIKGIGPKLAKNIINQFGSDSISIIENQPEELVKIKGISKNKAYEISAQFQAKKEERDAYSYLYKLGFSTNIANKIYSEYKDEIYSVIKNNPYILAEEIESISFVDIDKIAINLGIDNNSDKRIESAVIYCLNKQANKGHLYITEEVLYKEISILLEFEILDFEIILNNMLFNRKITIKEINDNKCIFLLKNYNTEKNLSNLLIDKNNKIESDNDIDIFIKKFEERNDILLDQKQIQAIEGAYLNNIFLLTGGPGTGKTTIIKAMIEIFEDEGLKVSLAAPTGRAARRMTEACKKPAKTIHKLLEVSSISVEKSERIFFNINENNHLDSDVVIIDEMSMVDIYLMYALVKGLDIDTRLILVGDIDQLPSVGPGSVFKDMITSNLFACVELDTIFRQAAKSKIVLNAHRINKGEELILDNFDTDFFFINKNNETEIIDTINDLVANRLPDFTNTSSFDIQVLTPMRKGNLGSIHLNKVLQKYINKKNSKEVEANNFVFKIDDKIMQTKNNYDLSWQRIDESGFIIDEGKGIFNGDIGKVIDIDYYLEKLIVEFDDKKTTEYDLNNLVDLELAYAITIHKSQGSEYDVIVLPIFNGPPLLFYRNILYTAITRAKKYVIIVGSYNKVKEMINNKRETNRNTALKYFLQNNSNS